MPRKKITPEEPMQETTELVQETSAKIASEPQTVLPERPFPQNLSTDRRNFYQLDLNELDRELTPEERQEWNSIYASYRSHNVLSGTIVGVDRRRLDGNGEIAKEMHCALVIPFRVRIFIPDAEMWSEGRERPGFVLRNMPGATIDFVIIHVDSEGGFTIGSRRLAMAARRYYFST